MGILFVLFYVLLSAGSLSMNKIYQSHVKTTAVSYTLYMVCLTVTSRFIFKEKLSGFNYASVALAVAAVILSVL